MQPGIAKGRELLVELGVGRVVRQVADAVKNIFRERRPDFFIHRFGAGKLVERRAQFCAPRSIRLLASREADDAERRGHLLLLEQLIERGDQLARREVAARAEDDDGAGVEIFVAAVTAGGGGGRVQDVHGRNLGSNASGFQPCLFAKAADGMK